MPTDNAPSGEKTVLFADVEGLTEAARVLSLVEYRRVAHEVKVRFKTCCAQYGGAVQAEIGDGLLATFARADQALACAIGLQKAFDRRGPDTIVADMGGSPWPVHIRVGIDLAPDEPHAGEAEASSVAGAEIAGAPRGDLAGKEARSGRNSVGTDTAGRDRVQRIGSCAVGGQILVSEAAYQRIEPLEPSSSWICWENRLIAGCSAPETVYELLTDGKKSPGSLAPTWAPAWLLRDTDPFVGRERCLSAIETWLGGNSSLLVLHGKGGVGKTRLAAEAVRRFGARFRGRIYGRALDQEFGEPPDQVTPGMLAARIAETIGAPESVCADVTELYPYAARRLTAPCLLVLDGFESAGNAQNWELLDRLCRHAPGLRCLVTCRECPPSLPHTNRMEVHGLAIPESARDPLEAFDGFRLFRVRMKSCSPPLDLTDTAALVRVLKAAEGNALGIELIASHSGSPSLTLQKIADGLKVGRLPWLGPGGGNAPAELPRDQTLHACFQWSFQRLSEEAQRHYPRLSLFPADFDLSAAQAVTGISETCLEELASFYLIRRETTRRKGAARRYRLPSSLRDCAAGVIGEAERAEAAFRFGQYYAHLAAQNSPELQEGAPPESTCAEIRNFHAAAAYLCTRPELTPEFADCLPALADLLLAIPAALRFENLQQAIDCYQAALRVFTEADFPVDWARIQNNLGIAYRNLPTGDPVQNQHKAIACFEAALRVRTETAFPLHWARIQNNLGNVYQSLPGEDPMSPLDRALDCYQAALRVYTETDFPIDWARIQNNLGAVYRSLPVGTSAQSRLQALACFEAALRVYTEAGHPLEWARTTANRGLALAALGEAAEARKDLLAALQQFRQQGAEHPARQCEEMLRRLEAQQPAFKPGRRLRHGASPRPASSPPPESDI